MDDADAIRRQQQGMLHHQAKALLSSHEMGGGGTLPRPKGLVKPIPVAKIVANAREPENIKLEDEDEILKMPNTSVPGLEPIIKLKQVLDPIPFANENAGTMRLRDSNSRTVTSEVHYSDADEVASSGGHSDLTSDLASEKSGEIVSPMGAGKQPKSADKRLAAANQAGQNRSAGDVLNDIGSMLADLTDELDAMLHSERDTN